MDIAKKIKIIYLITSTILIFSLINTNAIVIKHEEEQIIAKWTVMYYMCGDSTMDIYIEPLLEKLRNIGSNEELNIVCLLDRLEYGNSELIYINKTGNMVNLNDLYGWPAEVDMSNQNTFETFCTQVMQEYPANYYAFMTYASGGTGWTRYPIDDNDGRGFLTLPELASSLKKITNNGTNKIDVLQTSCCMSNIELSYEIAGYADYLITTQEHIAEKTIIPRFYKLVWDLKNNTDMNPEEFAKNAALKHEPHSYQYYESYGFKLSFFTKIFNILPFPNLHTVMMYSSVAIVNLSKIEEFVKAVDNLSSYMLLYLQDKNFINDLKLAREEVREFGKAAPKFGFIYFIYTKLPIEILSYDCRIDLYNFVDLLRENTENTKMKDYCNSVIDKINGSIEELVKCTGDPTYGFNIFFPTSKRLYNKDINNNPYPVSYENLKFSKYTNWDEFLETYLNV